MVGDNARRLVRLGRIESEKRCVDSIIRVVRSVGHYWVNVIDYLGKFFTSFRMRGDCCVGTVLAMTGGDDSLGTQCAIPKLRLRLPPVAFVREEVPEDNY